MSEEGLYGKYSVVDEDGEPVEDCFVLEPADDPAARAALKAYALATENDALATDLFDTWDLERTPVETWEAHNEAFNYSPPEDPPEAWSDADYQELYDRVISRRIEWHCGKCTGRGPFRSLKKARRHVANTHGRDLVDDYALDEDDLDPAPDGGQPAQEAGDRAAANHGLDDYLEADTDE